MSYISFSDRNKNNLHTYMLQLINSEYLYQTNLSPVNQFNLW